MQSRQCRARGCCRAGACRCGRPRLRRRRPRRNRSVTVELGKPGQHAFLPNKLRFETGKLYKPGAQEREQRPALFHLARLHPADFTRKVQVVQSRDGKPLAEFKGTIREIEVYPRADRRMVVRAGGDRPDHRPALRHPRQGRQEPCRPRHGGRDRHRVSGRLERPRSRAPHRSCFNRRGNLVSIAVR